MQEERNEIPLIEARSISKWYPVHGNGLWKPHSHIRAVDDVSLSIVKGETLGLVGESGCGKSTLGLMLLHLIAPTRGEILYNGISFTARTKNEILQLRREIQIVFQDPFSSLNPRMTVGTMLREVLHVHGIVPEGEIHDRVVELLSTVGLNPGHARRYPHEFSGGQRQRIVIARSLAVRPRFIICDEPVSSLDVSIQSQILNLLSDLQEQYALTYLFIAHDLMIVRHMSDRIAVMYLGKIVELASREKLYAEPLHPYTLAILASAPTAAPGAPWTPPSLEGEVPSPARIPAGCAFHPRCPEKIDPCARVTPHLARRDSSHFVRCLLYPESWPRDKEPISTENDSSFTG